MAKARHDGAALPVYLHDLSLLNPFVRPSKPFGPLHHVCLRSYAACIGINVSMKQRRPNTGTIGYVEPGGIESAAMTGTGYEVT